MNSGQAADLMIFVSGCLEDIGYDASAMSVVEYSDGSFSLVLKVKPEPLGTSIERLIQETRVKPE